MSAPSRCFLLCASLLLTAGRSEAQISRVSDVDFTQNYTLTTVPLGLGGAYRALADSTAAIHLNPAGLAQHKGVASAGGDYLHSGFNESDVFHVVLADFKTTELLALAVAYDRDEFTAAGNGVTVQQITLAVAYPIGEILYFGLATKGYSSQVSGTFVSGPDGMDIDAGFLVKPIPMLSLALTAQNLVQGNKLEEFPLQVGFGSAVTIEPYARLAIDVTKNFQTPAKNDLNAYFGGEIRAVEGMYLRGGFGLDRIREDNFYSVGAAAVGPKASFNFTFSQRMSPTSETYGANVEFYF